jgi:hypothetical protein
MVALQPFGKGAYHVVQFPSATVSDAPTASGEPPTGAVVGADEGETEAEAGPVAVGVGLGLAVADALAVAETVGEGVAVLLRVTDGVGLLQSGGAATRTRTRLL